MKAMKRAERQVDTKGLAAAKKETTMTSEEWKALQKGMKEKWPVPDYMSQPHPENKGHTSYREETFLKMTRMQASTVISYRPHAKSPGSKSHVRYEKYAKAKTAGEALKKGAWPADWCWDYERGFLVIDENGLREEAIDISQVQDKEAKKLTDVDHAVFGWYKKELCKKLNLSQKELSADHGCGEGLIVRAHRLYAQKQAQRILQSAEKEKRIISDEELTEVLNEWGFARNVTRVNVMQEGQHFVWSDTLGLLRDRTGDIHCTRPSHVYPEVLKVMNKWLKDRLPDDVKPFVWTSLNVNKNYAAAIHRDGNNFGPSMIGAFGKFSGGELNYWPEDDGKIDLDELQKGGKHEKEHMNLGNGLALFNGNCAHSVNDFNGNRFSIVWFAGSFHVKMSDKVRKELESLDFNVPVPDQDPFELLRPPKKKEGLASPQKKKNLPSSRYWTRQELVSNKKRKVTRNGGA